MEEEVTLEPSVVKSLHFSFPALYSSVGESLEVCVVCTYVRLCVYSICGL